MPPKNKKWQFSLGFYTPIYGHFTFLVLLLFTNRVEYSFDFSWTDFLSLLSCGFLKTNSTINQEASRNISKKPTGSPQKAPRKPPVNYSGAQGRKSVHEKNDLLCTREGQKTETKVFAKFYATQCIWWATTILEVNGNMPQCGLPAMQKKVMAPTCFHLLVL